MVPFSSVSSSFGIDTLKVYGDSMVIVKWENDLFNLQVVDFHNWYLRTNLLLSIFSSIIIDHIYRELNMQVDTLSKQSLGGVEGILFWE